MTDGKALISQVLTPARTDLGRVYDSKQQVLLFALVLVVVCVVVTVRLRKHCYPVRLTKEHSSPFPRHGRELEGEVTEPIPVPSFHLTRQTRVLSSGTYISFVTYGRTDER